MIVMITWRRMACELFICYCLKCNYKEVASTVKNENTFSSLSPYSRVIAFNSFIVYSTPLTSSIQCWIPVADCLFFGDLNLQLELFIFQFDPVINKKIILKIKAKIRVWQIKDDEDSLIAQYDTQAMNSVYLIFSWSAWKGDLPCLCSTWRLQSRSCSFHGRPSFSL